MRPFQKINRKWVETKEIDGEGKLELQAGQRILDTRIIHEVVELRQPVGHGDSFMNARLPDYRTVVVLECVEYDTNI